MTKKDVLLAGFYTAFAVSLYALETLIPKPLPFLKIGLANVVILSLLAQNNVKIALIVALGKTLLGGFVTGALLSPGTLMSFAGTMLAFLAMLLMVRLPFSLVGVSVVGSIFHNFGQLLVARLFIIRDNSIFYLTPLLIFAGLVTGVFTAYLAKTLLTKLPLRETDEK